MAERKTGPGNEGRGTYTLELVGLEPGAARPPVVSGGASLLERSSRPMVGHSPGDGE